MALGFGDDDPVAVAITSESGHPPKPAVDAFLTARHALRCDLATVVSHGDRWSVNVEPVVDRGDVEAAEPDN